MDCVTSSSWTVLPAPCCIVAATPQQQFSSLPHPVLSCWDYLQPAVSILISRLIAQMVTEGKFGRRTTGGKARRDRWEKMTLIQLPGLNKVENYILVPSLSTYQTNKFSIPILVLRHHFHGPGMSVPKVHAAL